MAVRVQTRTDDFNEKFRKMEEDLEAKNAELEVRKTLKFCQLLL